METFPQKLVIQTRASRLVFCSSAIPQCVKGSGIQQTGTEERSVRRVKGSGIQQTGTEERSVRPIRREFTNRLPREQNQGHEKRNRGRTRKKVEQYIPITCDREWQRCPRVESALYSHMGGKPTREL